ncbi:hypothetical protein SAY86_020691 [Trapa natans]|uniref:Uncharacterized protein n=1 Tax=Trapa natans TaxID=22666 RepID=A0AAN7LP71_TRANT|nr:hypothetical protein SAY86_020691 [Trapa natans]
MCRYIWKLFIVTVACSSKVGQIIFKISYQHWPKEQLHSTYHITIRCPRHDIPFDCDVTIGIQRIISGCRSSEMRKIFKKLQNGTEKMDGVSASEATKLPADE